MYVNPDDIHSLKACKDHEAILLRHVARRRQNSNESINETLVMEAIRALMLKGPKYMLVAEYERLVDHVLFPASQLLSTHHRLRFDCDILLHQLNVLWNSWTKLERGWRRLRIAELSLRDGVDSSGKYRSGQDPNRHLSAAIRLARECHGDYGCHKLEAEIAAVCMQYGIDLTEA